MIKSSRDLKSEPRKAKSWYRSGQQTKPFANNKGIIEGISIFDDIKGFENLIDESQQKLTHPNSDDNGYLMPESNSDIRGSGGYLEPDVVGHETTRHFSDQQAKPFVDDEGIAEEIPIFENLEDLAANIDSTEHDNSNNSLLMDPSPRSNSYFTLPSNQVSPRNAAMRDLEELANYPWAEHHRFKGSRNSPPEGSNVKGPVEL